ncbi:hypothetical protein ZIOFF_018209 [Zingiber officinale]|uniref:Uncharacterized protein n=1 Tax=Zingiber officinale TaxID=94328 RepID=A0A8J5LL27_ZINOF|nr:hypothetical protein ZIOFF_018209 [Zingiber officinale]
MERASAREINPGAVAALCRHERIPPDRKRAERRQSTLGQRVQWRCSGRESAVVAALGRTWMSSNSGFTVTYSSSIYLCFGCELDLASTAQLIFRFTRSSSIRSLMRNSIGHMECEDFRSVLGILIQGKLCVEFWLYFYEYLEDMHLYRIMLEIL